MAHRSYLSLRVFLGLLALGLATPSRAVPGSETAGRAVHAASTPLEDIGLRREQIPAAIASAVEVGYAPPRSCIEASVLILGLDATLGPDIDSPPEEQASMWERGAKAASNLIVDAAKDQATGLIPFRGVVRKISGAEAHKKAVSRAQMIARARRAFLKGWHSGRGC